MGERPRIGLEAHLSRRDVLRGISSVGVLAALGGKRGLASCDTGTSGGEIDSPDLSKLTNTLPSLGDLAFTLPRDPQSLQAMGVTLQSSKNSLIWTRILINGPQKTDYTITLQFPPENKRQTQNDFASITGFTVDAATSSVEPKPSGYNGIISERQLSLITTEKDGKTAYTLASQTSGQLDKAFQKGKTVIVTVNTPGNPMIKADLDGFVSFATEAITQLTVTDKQ